MPPASAPRSDDGRRLLLGIDTGGTYTDAVVFDERHGEVVAKAKSPTTYGDLSIGIWSAIDHALNDARVSAAEIQLVALSTTLATNALVEGRGRRVGAVLIGFDTDVIERMGLQQALGGDPVLMAGGGHDPFGNEREPLCIETLDAEIAHIASSVEAFAVTAHFSVRNPQHENAARDYLRARTGLPVSCSHELSARLNGPKRAVTTVLNARLISIVDELMTNTRAALDRRGAHAPLMVVRGDGSLVSAYFMRERPIETILSGPAASVVGAAFLTGLESAIVSDIGGTTTDIAVLRNGLPTVRGDGAIVGGHRTMVSSIDMHTHGLGGDSEVGVDEAAGPPTITIGPRRVVPVSRLAGTFPAIVDGALERQLAAPRACEHDGVFVMRRVQAHTTLDGHEMAALDRLGTTPTPADRLIAAGVRWRAVESLVRRGLAQLAAFTPTDAAAVLGLHDHVDAGAARKAAALFARRRDRLGRVIAADAIAVAELVVSGLVRRSAEAILMAGFDHDGIPAAEVGSVVVQRALDGTGVETALVATPLALNVALVALGASAATYYPRVAKLLGTVAVVPEHADVANAIGAVVGRVTITREVTVSSPGHGHFVVHTEADPLRASSVEEARSFAEAHLTRTLAADMAKAGAPTFEIRTHWAEQTVHLDGSEMFVEGVLTATASGRPHIGVR